MRGGLRVRGCVGCVWVCECECVCDSGAASLAMGRSSLPQTAIDASVEEEPGDLTCVAKLTDRWDRALISARQLTPV